ncbi:hypothetical protein H7S74_30260 [Priestia aryabhattai]|uniref:hypothetical protein n=1 Tax=Priestia aryabhattai TaxID=412384 RepID=UPI001EB18BA0|nr:hypothetical protein [Priestia aryabhattai]MBY0094933.1 hypothetical protein [Priestia aryabhattai]MBY0105579.1 hypothetical protein [Priestia aryabhattai]
MSSDLGNELIANMFKDNVDRTEITVRKAAHIVPPTNNTDTHTDNDTPVVPKGRPLSHVDAPHVVGEPYPYHMPHDTPIYNPSDVDGYACAIAEIDVETTVNEYINERTTLTQEMKDKHETLDAIVTLYKHEMISKEELVKYISDKL